MDISQVEQIDTYSWEGGYHKSISFCAGEELNGKTNYTGQDDEPRYYKETRIIEWEVSYPDTVVYKRGRAYDDFFYHTIRERKDDPAKEMTVTVRVRWVGLPPPDFEMPEGYSTYRGPWSPPWEITVYPKAPQLDMTNIHSSTPLTTVQGLTERNGTFELRHVPCLGGNNGQAIIKKLTSMERYRLTLTKQGQGPVNYIVPFAPSETTPYILSNLNAGTYELKIETFKPGTNELFGCFSTQYFTIKQPTATFQSTASKLTPYHGFDISCHGSADGRVSINAKGGLTPYALTLKGFIGNDPNPVIQRTNPDLVNGMYVFQNLPRTNNDGSPIDYSVTMKDGGCDAVKQAGPFRLNTPPPVIIRYSDKADSLENHYYNIRCFDSTDDMQVSVTGGTSKYAVWLDNLAIVNDVIQRIDSATSGDKPIFTSLPAGQYAIHAVDRNGCVATQAFEFTQPQELTLQSNVTQAVCTGNTGSIQITGAGGVPYAAGVYEYALKHNDQVTEKELAEALFDNLTSGTYTLTLTDANACVAHATYDLAEPVPVELDITGDEFYCAGQTVTLDAGNPGAIYRWTTSFGAISKERTLTATTTGTYSVTVTNEFGCQAQSSRKLTFGSDILKADFIASSDGFAGDTVVLINISFPLPDSAYWTFPEGVQVVDSSAFVQYLVFPDPGTYVLTLSATKGACLDQISDSITILEAGESGENSGGRQASLISDFVIHPNPSSGRFTIGVQLREAADVAVDIFSTAGAPWASYQESGSRSYEISAALSAPTGVYYVVLRAGNEKKVRRIVIYK